MPVPLRAVPRLAKGRERARSYFNGGSETLFTRVEEEETAAKTEETE